MANKVGAGPAAAVITRSPSVYNDVSVSLRTMGIPTIYHLSPHQMLEAPVHWFWVMDGRVPGAVHVVQQMLKQGRRQGLFLSTRGDAHLNRSLVELGVPAMLLHRAVELPEERGASSLTAREVQILQLCSQGNTNITVGQELRISPLTVKSHLARLGKKMGTGDRAHMVAIALRAGAIY